MSASTLQPMALEPPDLGAAFRQAAASTWVVSGHSPVSDASLRVLPTAEELRALQRPLKQAYKEDPTQALVTSTLTATLASDGIAATVGRDGEGVRAGLHPVAGGDGSEACSADLLLEALAACAGVTLRSVATALGVTLRSGSVHATGTWDARGTLGVDRDTPVGITSVRLEFDLDTDADEATTTKLLQLTERYCVIAQTLLTPPSLEVALTRA